MSTNRRCLSYRLERQAEHDLEIFEALARLAAPTTINGLDAET
jgi:hypothetical protein